VTADEQERARRQRAYEHAEQIRAGEAQIALQAFALLHPLLSDGGEPLTASDHVMPQHYLTGDEWAQVTHAARALAEAAEQIADGPHGLRQR
jgi:hypothetical protein